MSDNKTKVDRLHDLLPKIYKTRVNTNWKAIVEALGESDQHLADLVQEVRKQFFVKTASRPYLDRLGSNFKVSRPRLVGMDDPTFRTYIPVLAYQPKQVKLVIDSLLDIFFFKESTTAFIQSTITEPFSLQDDWKLEFVIDSQFNEQIIFSEEEFTDISNVTADELVGAYNRQSKYSFAIVFDDRVRKEKYIRVFSNTVGSKGSVTIAGGLTNISLQFSGYNKIAGAKSNTEWTITKIGNEMTFQHTAGGSPGIETLQIGDIVLIDIPNNKGSFVITDVDAGNAKFNFVNVFGTEMVHNHATSPNTYVNFLTPIKSVVYTRNNRAVVWEVSPGEIIIEMPASPPVVKRSLIGSAHINGNVKIMESRDSDTSMTIEDASDWPDEGSFILQQKCAITRRISTIDIDEEEVVTFDSRYDKSNKYSYTSKSNNQIIGISPSLPPETMNFQHDIVTATRTLNKFVEVNTANDHNFQIDEWVKLQDTIQGIQVDINLADTSSEVATKTAAAITSFSYFNASANSNIVTIENTSTGNTTDAADVTAGVIINITQQGSSLLSEITEVSTPTGVSCDVVGNGKYWTLWNAEDKKSFYVWYNVVDGINSQDNPILLVSVDGVWKILEIPTSTSFKIQAIGDNGTSTGGTARVERVAMASSGSLIHLASSNINTGILGPYMWDLEAPYVLSSLTSQIQTKINAGTTVRTLSILAGNNIPNEEGYVIFDFGTEREEGPVRYLFKPNDNSMQLDPAYIYKNNHEIGSQVTVIRNRGPIRMSGYGIEYGAYLTDPSIAREILQDLIKEVKSVGIFLEFLVRYPSQLYSILDIYNSGNENLWPVGSSDP